MNQPIRNPGSFCRRGNIKKQVHQLVGNNMLMTKVKEVSLDEFPNAPAAAARARTITRLKICDSQHACDILAVTSDLPSSVLVVVFHLCAKESHLMWGRGPLASLCLRTAGFSRSDERKRDSGRAGSRHWRVLAVTAPFLTPPHACCPAGYQHRRSRFLPCSASL